MKFIFTTIFLSLFCVFFVFAQNDIELDLSFLDSIKIPLVEIEREKEEEEIVFSFDAFTDPTFEGGMSNFYKIIEDNLRFPEGGKEGRVFVTFIIDTAGKMTDFRIVKSIHEENSKEILKVMNLINENYSWKPSIDTRTHKKKKSRITIPIVFKEENKTTQNSKKFKITVTEYVPPPRKREFFIQDGDTAEIRMEACFYYSPQIEYIEIERDTNNQEYLIYNVVENPPVFEGGMDNFYKIIQKNLEFAEKPKEISSRAFIEFVIDTTGKMTDFKILKSNFSKKNNDGFLQLLDFINKNYTWQPAIYKGKKVFYRMNLPIRICRLD